MFITDPIKKYRMFGGSLDSDDIAPIVFIPGSKSRVLQFAEYCSSSRKIVNYHEFLVYTGVYQGVPITACSTGIGGASVAVAVQELVKLGADTLIRVGVTGTLQEFVDVGDIIIASGAIRSDQISKYYLPNDFPALSSRDVLLSLVAACQNNLYKFHVGITATTGSFYCGEGRPGANNYYQSFMKTIIEDFTQSGVLDWDTETSILFTLGRLLGARVGRINGVLDSPRSNKTDPEAENRAVKAALDAAVILTKWDKMKKKKNVNNLFPNIEVEIK